MLAIEFQIKEIERVEKALSTVTRVSVTLALVSLIVWLWIQAPGLNFTLPLGGGAVNNINVGYAVVFGPLIISFLSLWQFIVRRKLALLVAALDYDDQHQECRKLGSLPLLLGNFSHYKEKYYSDPYWVANWLLRNIFYFLIPGIVSIVCFFRLIDFIPMEVNGEKVVMWDKAANPARYKCDVEAKNNPCSWGKMQRIKYWLIGVNISGVQPTMMNRVVEQDKKKGGNFPYIYPYTVWINILLMIINIWLAIYCYKLSGEPFKMHNKKIQSSQ